MVDPLKPYRGRGATGNIANRFEAVRFERDESWTHEDDPTPTTKFYRDVSKTILASNDSPDVGFDTSINPYRGCEHGCVYCYARPTHEYLGMSAGLDFESKIFVKHDAPALLRRALAAPKWKPQVIAISGVTDCYQPVERRLQLTRRILEVLLEFRNPVGIITKNALVARDLDIFKKMAEYRGVHVTLSITSLDGGLARVLEPRTSQPKARLEALRQLSEAGISTGVNVAPVIPGLNDHEMAAVLQASRDAGASSAGYVLVRLPGAVSPLFEKWLEAHFPQRKEKIMHRIRETRGGKNYDAQFGKRRVGEGAYAKQLADLFQIACRKAGYPAERQTLSTAAFRRPAGPQLDLFEV